MAELRGAGRHRSGRGRTPRPPRSGHRPDPPGMSAWSAPSSDVNPRSHPVWQRLSAAPVLTLTDRRAATRSPPVAVDIYRAGDPLATGSGPGVSNQLAPRRRAEDGDPPVRLRRPRAQEQDLRLDVGARVVGAHERAHGSAEDRFDGL